MKDRSLPAVQLAIIHPGKGGYYLVGFSYREIDVAAPSEAAATHDTGAPTTAATGMAKFADIATKIDSYHTTKLVPAGKTVATYSTLKSDITS